MAGTIQYHLKVSDTYGSKQSSVVNRTSDVSVAVNTQAAGVISVGTAGAGELLPVGEVTAPGYVYMRNLDATNDIKVGKDNAGAFEAFARLKPDKEAWFYVDDSISLRVLAVTADCELEYKIYGR